jgi:hypothetical protein
LGNIVYLAKKTSAFSWNYDIQDGNGVNVGYIKSQRGLRSLSFLMEDSNHAPLGKVTVQSNQSSSFGLHARALIWMEDPNGQRQFEIQYQNGVTVFAGVRADGTKIFDCSLNQREGGGLKQELSAFNHENYIISLYDPDFLKMAMISMITAWDSGYQ